MWAKSVRTAAIMQDNFHPILMNAKSWIDSIGSMIQVTLMVAIVISLIVVSIYQRVRPWWNHKIWHILPQALDIVGLGPEGGLFLRWAIIYVL